MTQTLSPNDAEIRDFSRRIDVRFRVDEDVFVGVAGIPALDLLEFGALYDGLSETDIMKKPEAFTKMINLVLQDESAQRFNARMSDRSNPISMVQVMEILPWIMERYGMRPTEPSFGSSSGSPSPGDGTRSTASVSPLGLTYSDFQPTDS